MGESGFKRQILNFEDIRIVDINQNLDTGTGIVILPYSTHEFIQS